MDILFFVQGNERYKSWGPRELDTFLVDYELERRQKLFISSEAPTRCIRNHVHFTYIIIIPSFQTKKLRHWEVNLFEVTVY